MLARHGFWLHPLSFLDRVYHPRLERPERREHKRTVRAAGRVPRSWWCWAARASGHGTEGSLSPSIDVCKERDHGTSISTLLSAVRQPTRGRAAFLPSLWHVSGYGSEQSDREGFRSAVHPGKSISTG